MELRISESELTRLRNALAVSAVTLKVPRDAAGLARVDLWVTIVSSACHDGQQRRAAVAREPPRVS